MVREHMGIGYEGFCKLADQDDEIAIYTYSGADINDNFDLRKKHLLDYDGVIVIYKRCLEEPEIHTKTVRRPSGRKYERVKRITHVPNILRHIKNGDIVIEKECFNAFRRCGWVDVDYIAYNLLYYIFVYYQEKGCLPEDEMFAV